MNFYYYYMSFYNLDENSPTLKKQPKGLKVKLRPHQLTSVKAMLTLEENGTVVIDKPDITTPLYQSIKHKINDTNEMTQSTFVLETNSAILGDPVGAGKSYILLSLILANPIPKTHDRFILGTDHYSIKMISEKVSEQVNLIVVPHNLANQWGDFLDKTKLSYLKFNTISDFDIFFDLDYVTKQEITIGEPLTLYTKSKKKKIPKKKIKTKSGSKTQKITNEQIYERRRLNPDKVKEYLNNKQVFVLNVNRYRFFKQIFRNINWARVIIDEMDSANIPTMFDEYGNFNWFVTATPTSIFYKSCRRYVNKIFGYNHHLLQYFIVKNREEYVNSSIVLPKPYAFMIDTLLQRVVSAIQDLIPADVLQLINAGNMREAVAKLNCDIDTEENIVKVLTDKIKTELHNLTKELEYVESLIPADEDAHEKRIEKLKKEIDRCKIKLQTVDERIGSIKDECCFICAESFDTPTILDCCKSVFCFKCLLSSLKMSGNKCPYCMHVIKNNKEYHVITNDPHKKKNKIVEKISSGEKPFKDMDKADVLEKILMNIAKNDESPRILIFSDYAQTFEKIIKNISKANLQYALISGVPAHITNVINQFNEGVTNILLLDSQHYGSGLNLQAANYLILYHRMNKELEIQVLGRAHRFGRKTPLKVIYLVNDAENKTTNLTNNPITPVDESELWMLMNPPDNQAIIEEYNDSDEESPKKTQEPDLENNEKHNTETKSIKKVKNKKKIENYSDSESEQKSKKSKNKIKSGSKKHGKKKKTESESDKKHNKKSKKKIRHKKIVVV